MGRLGETFGLTFPGPASNKLIFLAAPATFYD